MSSPSLPKSLPVLFDSETRDKVGALMLQPMSLAILASLGMHGLLWFGLPLMTASESKQGDAQRSVPLVELSPLEQARLPQLSASPTLLGLPKSSTVPNSLVLTPANPQISSQDSTSFYNVPPQTDSPTIVPYPLSSLRQRSPRKSSADTNLDSETKSKPDPKDAETQSEPDAKESPDSTVSSKAEDLLPPKQQDPQSKVALQQKYAYSAENTSQEDFATNSTVLSQTAQDVSKGDISEDWKKLDVMSVPYPKDACQFKHEGKAIAGEPWFGVIVQPNGKLAATPTLLRSSGFKGLDEAAIEFIAKYSFEASKQYRGFYFPIKFELTKTDCVATDVGKPSS